MEKITFDNITSLKPGIKIYHYPTSGDIADKFDPFDNMNIKEYGVIKVLMLNEEIEVKGEVFIISNMTSQAIRTFSFKV